VESEQLKSYLSLCVIPLFQQTRVRTLQLVAAVGSSIDGLISDLYTNPGIMVQEEAEQEAPEVQDGEVIEWFVGFKEDYTMVYLMDCPQCDVLITYLEQGHHCCGIVSEDNFKEWEAYHYAVVIQGLVEIYAVADLENVD
jgi:hypothetical protein